jgi:hypothetical protein
MRLGPAAPSSDGSSTRMDADLALVDHHHQITKLSHSINAIIIIKLPN